MNLECVKDPHTHGILYSNIFDVYFLFDSEGMYITFSFLTPLFLDEII